MALAGDALAGGSSWRGSGSDLLDIPTLRDPRETKQVEGWPGLSLPGLWIGNLMETAVTLGRKQAKVS